MGSPSDGHGSRASADGPSSLGCPMYHGCHSSHGCSQVPWVLRLQSQHRAGEACRGQPAPSQRARGGQSPAVSLNAPLCARQQGGRAWLSLGLGTLVGWGGPWAVAGQEQGGPPYGDPCPFLAYPKSPPLACPQTGWGGNTNRAAVQMLPGLHGGQLDPALVGPSSWPPAQLPASPPHQEAG